MFALVDCNNFFVSCERVFQPALEGRPLVVLSSNDGCVVSRSNEAKAMDIRMGTPFFRIKDLAGPGRLEVRSSNYVLYSDLSARVMSVLRDAVPEVEQYSVDEAYLHLDAVEPDGYRAFCLELAARVKRWTGVPVSIGIAPTKTLCKVAGRFAKRYPGYRGVCLMDSEEKRLKALRLTAIEDVWGVGRRGAPKLKALHIATALDYASRPLAWAHRHLGVNGARLWNELNGVPAVEEMDRERSQSISNSRSFAEMTGSFDVLSAKVSDFAGMCAEKLRREHSVCSEVGVFILTNRFREDLSQYNPSLQTSLPTPTNATSEIVSAALTLLGEMFRPGYLYKKAGVVVSGIGPADAVQRSLFGIPDELREKEDRVSQLLDSINARNSGKLQLASQSDGGFSAGVRREHCSRQYSTDWKQLIEVK